MRPTPRPRSRLLVFALIATLIFAGCRPDDTLDITPSPTPTPDTDRYTVRRPRFRKDSWKPSTPMRRLSPPCWSCCRNRCWRVKRNGSGIIRAGINGIGRVRGVRGTAVATRVYYRSQEGGLINLDFAIFDTAEEAAANYERHPGHPLGIRNRQAQRRFSRCPMSSVPACMDQYLSSKSIITSWKCLSNSLREAVHWYRSRARLYVSLTTIAAAFEAAAGSSADDDG